MPLNPTDLSKLIILGLKGTAPTAQSDGLAKAIIKELQSTAQVVNAPGTVNGTAPPTGGPLIGGTSSGGKITILNGSMLDNRILLEDSKDFQATPQISGIAKGIVTHILTAGTVNFSTIDGMCTNTPSSPGLFTGSGSGGKIVGLNGQLMAQLVVAQAKWPSVTPEILNMCNAICNYVMTMGVVTYSSVSGICSAGGGPLVNGQASGGRIV